MLALLLAAVAGGTLGVTATPAHPRVGKRVEIALTGQVGTRGHLYVYRNLSKRCADTVRGERQIGTRLASWVITQPFDHRVAYIPRRVRTEWVCAYLYADSCDAAGRNCGPATGLPPDAGWAQVRIRVRPASHSVNSPAGSGRVIT